MAKYLRLKQWISEVLFSADLNAEFDAVRDAVNSVSSEQIEQGAVGATQLSANAVETDKIKAKAVTGDKLADNATTDTEFLSSTAQIDLDTASTDFELISQTIQLASPAGAVLALFSGVVRLGKPSVSGPLNIFLNFKLKRDGVTLRTDQYSYQYRSTEFDLPEDYLIVMQWLDAAALSGSEPIYSVDVSASRVFGDTVTQLQQSKLMLVELRK